MINFEPKKTYAYRAFVFEKQTPAWLFGTFTNILMIIASGLLAIVLLIWLRIDLGILGYYFSQWLGLLVLATTIVFLLISWRAFLDWLKTPHPKRTLAQSAPDIKAGKANVANWTSFEALHTILTATEKSSKRTEASFSLILLSELIRLDSAKFILMRLGIQPEELDKQLKQEQNSAKDGKGLQDILDLAIDAAVQRGKPYITIGDLFASLAKNDPFFAGQLFEKELDVEDVKNIGYWAESLEERERNRGKFWTYENLVRMPGIGRDWAAGYTIGLDQFSQDMT